MTEWLFIFYTGYSRYRIVAMYPATRSVEATEFVGRSTDIYKLRSATWDGGRLPNYDQTVGVG
jgi:hypothetical protein